MVHHESSKSVRSLESYDNSFGGLRLSGSHLSILTNSVNMAYSSALSTVTAFSKVKSFEITHGSSVFPARAGGSGRNSSEAEPKKKKDQDEHERPPTTSEWVLGWHAHEGNHLGKAYIFAVDTVPLASAGSNKRLPSRRPHSFESHEKSANGKTTLDRAQVLPLHRGSIHQHRTCSRC